jgi:hypothetical protein
MVEGHIRRQVVNIEPLRLCCVIAGLYTVESIFDNAHKNDGDLPASRVSAEGAEGVHLFEFDSSETCFFLQFSCGGVFKLFVNIYEAAGNCPFAFVGVIASFYEEKFGGVSRDSEDCGIRRNHWSWPFVNVFSFFVHTGQHNEYAVFWQLPKGR